MQAIILAGGYGTRLKSAVAELPKPLAAIGDKPFLSLLLDYLQKQGISSVIMAVSYMHEKISNYYGNRYGKLDIQYVVEEEPLGTGGAILNAMSKVTDDYVFILNGDTLLKLDYSKMKTELLAKNADMAIALRHVSETSRYGSVVLEGEKIVAFNEKSADASDGLINAGVYLLKPELLRQYNLPKRFSLETDFLLQRVADIKPLAYISHDYFIDIGIPEDYQRAQQELRI